MSVVVFLGPTLPIDEARAELEATYRPPAAHGDVLRAALGGPIAIGLVDGYFERVPAVWHKEILFAMSRGIHVFGAASMGALRAAELAAFGMEGVGAVYEAYARGDLDADDEVAVAHAPAEQGYRCLSEAMVDIRATLRAAEAAGAIDAALRASLERTAKDLFYPDRCYPMLLRRAEEEGAAPAALAALRAFLRAGRVRQKRLDALAMLRTIRTRLSDRMEPKRVHWHFEHTDAWEHMLRIAERGPPG
jgi:hypothetical protein